MGLKPFYLGNFEIKAQLMDANRNMSKVKY
jgi:hypothetical protein